MNVIVTGLPDHDEIMDLMANYSQATGDLKINYIMFQNTLCLDIALIEKKQISKIKCLAWLGGGSVTSVTGGFVTCLSRVLNP